MKKSRLILLLILVIGAALYFFISPGKKIDYNTQVKPILNKKCIACHGGVKQQGGFSLLFREEALLPTKSGKYGIVPGNAARSEMIRRIKEKDEEERMPYKHEPLSKGEIKILERWVKQGAQWGTHWAYAPVEKAEAPDENNKWIKNDIDKFIYKKLSAEKLNPSTEAEKATLLRRVSLDITGLPPSDSIAQIFLGDSSANGYNNLLDALFASSTYGERWTSMWMDLARYSDTKGFESDQPRTIWRYRDWLIKAFNADKPYNDFLTEQIAGDLMPGVNDDKYIATAFHRNTLNNDEGGTDNEEFRTSEVIDRVNTTWSALMGTTFNCVQCHSHPYDPFKHDEYYKFMAFFNNTRDEDLPPEYPQLRFYSGKDSSKQIQLQSWLAQQKDSWYSGFVRTLQPSVNSHLCDTFIHGVLYSNNHAGIDAGGSCRLRNITTTGKQNLLIKYLNNKPNTTLYIYADSLKGTLLQKIPLIDTKGKWKIEMGPITSVQGKHDVWFRFECTQQKDELPLVLDWLALAPSFPQAAGADEMKKNFIDLVTTEPASIPIMIENNEEQRRVTNVFERGSWLSKGAIVTPGVPHIMNPMPDNAPANRFGLAMWLTDKKNPLTARTMVNRIWEQLFGTGLAETLEDLGTQGMPPVHKELLDYLSWKFMNDYNWSIKKLLKEIVSSATYRQSSKTTAELIAKDPNNVLLARYSRIRLTGEQLRDQCLFVSGLISNKMYGESVMPFQPEGLWSSPYNDAKWILSKGEDQYRRALYTYVKRTSPYPSLINFDGGSHEVCLVRRIRTNTPLQALNSLNDSAYLIMARGLAAKMNKEKNGTAPDKIAQGYYSMFYKTITAEKLKVLDNLYNKAIAQYKVDKTAANEMMGDKKKTALPEDAAMTVVANAMLNLDEWVNKN